ncbi:hypothetical protein FF2_024556 [Malus domestica]
MVVRQGVWMVYGGVEWCMVVEKGCGKVWEMAGMDGGVAAKGIRMMVAAARCMDGVWRCRMVYGCGEGLRQGVGNGWNGWRSGG